MRCEVKLSVDGREGNGYKRVSVSACSQWAASFRPELITGALKSSRYVSSGSFGVPSDL